MDDDDDIIADKLRESMNRSEERFWLESPLSLFKSWKFLPSSAMTDEQRFNALTRLLIIVCVIMLICRSKYWSYTLAIGMAVIIGCYYASTKKRSSKEGYLPFEDLPSLAIRMHGPGYESRTMSGSRGNPDWSGLYSVDGLARLATGGAPVAQPGMGSGRNYICNRNEASYNIFPKGTAACNGQGSWGNNSGVDNALTLGLETPTNTPVGASSIFRAPASGIVPLYSAPQSSTSSGPHIYDSDPMSTARRISSMGVPITSDGRIITGPVTPKRFIPIYENPTSLDFDSPYDEYDSPGWTKGGYDMTPRKQNEKCTGVGGVARQSTGEYTPTHIYDPHYSAWVNNHYGVGGEITNTPGRVGVWTGPSSATRFHADSSNGGYGARSNLANRVGACSGSQAVTEGYSPNPSTTLSQPQLSPAQPQLQDQVGLGMPMTARRFHEENSQYTQQNYGDSTIGGADRWTERQQSYRPLNDTRRATRQGKETNSRQGMSSAVNYSGGNYRGTPIGYGGEVMRGSNRIIPLNQTSYIHRDIPDTIGGAFRMDPNVSENIAQGYSSMATREGYFPVQHSGQSYPSQPDYSEESSVAQNVGYDSDMSESRLNPGFARVQYDLSPNANYGQVTPQPTHWSYGQARQDEPAPSDAEYVSINSISGITTEAQRVSGIGLQRGQAHQVIMAQQAAVRESMEGSYRNIFRSKRGQCGANLSSVNAGMSWT